MQQSDVYYQLLSQYVSGIISLSSHFAHDARSQETKVG